MHVRDPNRRTGRTTRQIMALPIRGVFIWCNESPRYAREIALSIGRPDVRVHSIAMLDGDRHLVTLARNMVALDHAAHEYMTPLQRQTWANFQRMALDSVPDMATG